MGTRPTAIVSCFGLIGLIIALIFGDKSDEAKHYLKQSGNACICTIIVSAIVSICCGWLGGGIIATILSVAGNLYGLVIFIQILISAINLDRRVIGGMIYFIK